MVIEPKKVVSVSYVLREKTADGRVLEKTADEQPFYFLFGVGGLLPDFESNLAGLKVGDTFAFGIEHKKAYGAVDESAIVEIPIQSFYVDGKLATDMLQLGNTIPMRTQDGNTIRGVVKAVTADMVRMDFNHPMAGIDLFFTGEVKSIRDATPEEIDHKHVHGPGGHHH